MLPRTLLTLAAAILVSAPLPAADKKPGPPRDFPLWTAPKRPHAHSLIPGLQAALQLTPEQLERLEAACRETIDKPEARGKNAPGAEAAAERLHAAIAGILTPEQKKLIEKVNDAYARAAADTAGEFEANFAAAKGNEEETAKVRKEYAEAVAAAFEKRLDAILPAEQREAVKKAGAEQKRREEEAARTPKPKK